MLPFTPSYRPIPLELLTRIITHEIDAAQDNATLAILARTCRVAHKVAIPVLYEHIHLRSDWQIKLLLQDLSLKGGEDDQEDGHEQSVRSGLISTATCLLEVQKIYQVQPGVLSYTSDINPGRITRKLSFLLFTRYLTLHHIPGPDILNRLRSPTGRHYEMRIGVEDHLGRPRTLSRYTPNLARCKGVALGQEFMEGLVERVAMLWCGSPGSSTEESECCGIDDNAALDLPAEDGMKWVKWRHCLLPLFGDGSGTLNGVNHLLEVLQLHCVPMCVALNDMESLSVRTDLDSEERKRAIRIKYLVMQVLMGDQFGRTIQLRNTHSSIGNSTLTPLTLGGRRHWRHFISVPSEEDTGRPILPILDGIARDVYGIANNTLESIAYGEKPRRRDMILSGLTNDQVRELEQRFVEVVKQKFGDPQEVIVDPSLRTPGKSHSKDEGDDEEYESSEDVYDPNDNRYGDGDSDPEDEDAVREYQRRVNGFDFFHWSKTRACEGCGEGGRYDFQERDRGKVEAFIIS